MTQDGCAVASALGARPVSESGLYVVYALNSG